jgi:hypothetical protein
MAPANSSDHANDSSRCDTQSVVIIAVIFIVIISIIVE